MKRVAIYLRVSTAKQAEDDRQSLKLQREVCLRRLRAEPDWVLVADDAGSDPDGLHVDVVSGLETEKRHAYQRLIAMARKKRVDIILCYRYDRLGRDDAELIARARELGRLKVTLISATEGERDNFMLSLGFLLAQRESEELSKRVTPAMRRVAEEGRWAARAPYGYRMVARTVPIPKVHPDGSPEQAVSSERTPTKGLLEVHPEQAAIVRELFARAAQGQSIHSMANWLNTLTGDDGQRLTSPGGRYFSTKWVRGLLGNPVYVGQVRHGLTYQSKIHGKGIRPPDEQYCGDGLHEPLVERDVFDAVQAILTSRPRFRARATGRQWLLTGLVRCGECGKVMQGKRVYRAKQRRAGMPYTSHTYYCQTKGHGSPGGKKLDAYVLDQLGRLCLDEQMIRDVEAAMLVQLDAQPAMLRELRATIAQLERRLKLATEMVLDGTMSRAVYRATREDVEARTASLGAELATLVQPARDPGHLAAEAGNRLRALRDLRGVLEKATLDQQAEILAGAIVGVTYHKDRPVITWQPWAAAALGALGASSRGSVPPFGD